MQMVVGADPVNMQSTVPVEGSIELVVNDLGDRWSHIQNTDEIFAKADFTAKGTHYYIEAHKPMPRHPLGAYTTWGGVVYRHNMHGDTGIGTGKIPKVKPDIALWAWGTVTKNGTLISKMAPIHIMVMKTDKTMPGIMLEVASEGKELLGTPDGYLTVHWPKIKEFEFPTQAIRMRQFAGWAALIGFVLLFWWLLSREALCNRRRRQDENYKDHD